VENLKPVKSRTSVLLEITNRCYTGCGHCFQRGKTNAKGAHVPLETVKKRMDWIIDNVDQKKILLMGGEPLAHPDLEKIILHGLKQDKTIAIITSGNVRDDTRHNLDVVERYFSLGWLDIDLSYQPGGNEIQFKEFLQMIDRASKKRKRVIRKWQKAINYIESTIMLTPPTERTEIENDYIKNICVEEIVDALTLKKPRISTTVTLDASFAKSFQKFAQAYIFISACMGENLSNQTITTDGQKMRYTEHIKRHYLQFMRHFLKGQNAQFYNTLETFSDSDQVEFDLSLRVWGAGGKSPHHDDGRLTMHRKGAGVCSAVSNSIDYFEETIQLSSMTVNTDGNITHSSPTCLMTGNQYGNVDEMDTRLKTYLTIKRNIELNKRIIQVTKSMRAKSLAEYCKTDLMYEGKGSCDSCEFDLACNVCANIDRDKAYLPTVRDLEIRRIAERFDVSS